MADAWGHLSRSNDRQIYRPCHEARGTFFEEHIVLMSSLLNCSLGCRCLARASAIALLRSLLIRMVNPGDAVLTTSLCADYGEQSGGCLFGGIDETTRCHAAVKLLKIGTEKLCHLPRL